MRYFDATAGKRKRILILLPLIILLWSNFHGAAAFVGICVYGSLGLHRLIALYKEKNLKSWECYWLITFGIVMAVATLVAPKGIGNISYLLDLTKDRSAEFILEWQAGTLVHYLKVTGFFWAIAIASTLYNRKQLLFTILLLCGIGYLAKTAVRHEVLFVITAISVTLYQLRTMQLIANRFSLALPVAVFVLIGCVTYVRSYDVNRNDHLFGYGTFAPARGASDFIKQEGITGNMFNNYNIGGEMLFHDHKVFLDGRNLDYGYEYINRAVNSGVDTSIWNELEREYQFTHAAIYYDLQAELNPIPYVDLLDADPDWLLVYVDDWAAVYVHKGIEGIDEVEEITSITPKMLHHLTIPGELTTNELNRLQNDLNRIIKQRPDGIKPRLYLARLYTMLGAYHEAEVLLNDAKKLQPKNFRVYLGFMELFREQGDLAAADRMLDKAKRTAGFTGVQIK